ncbi:MAG: SMC-Scp complex subunit ScpB [Parcubacteria group bacterium]|jgi:segregation and condensation protein B
MDSPKIKSIIESLLFVSGEPVKLAKLAKICQVEKKEVEKSLEEIDVFYKEQNSGFRVIKSGDSAQLGTSPENAEFVSQLVSGEINSELSKSALETLAIVAYRGPITRTQIEAIRGVNTSYILRSLLMRGIIERKEISETRGFLYEASFDFLKSVGIQAVKDLPDWDQLSKNEKIEEILAINQEENNITKDQ